MATAPVAYECGCGGTPKTADEWDAQVAKCFAALGSVDPAADMESASVYLGNAKRAGLPPGTAAGIAYATVHHAHPVVAVGAALPGVATEQAPAAETKKKRGKKNVASDYYAVIGHRKEGPFTSYSDAKQIADKGGGYVEFAGEKVEQDPEDEPSPEASLDLDKTAVKAMVSHAPVAKAPWRVTLLNGRGQELAEATDDSLLGAFDKAAKKALDKKLIVPAYLLQGFSAKYGAMPPASMMTGAYYGEWPATKDDDRGGIHTGRTFDDNAAEKTSSKAAEEAPPGPETAGEARPEIKGKPRKLHWHRGKSEGEYRAEGQLGAYEIVKRPPDRRHGILPHVLKLNGKELGGFDTKTAAQDFAASYDFVMPYAAPGETDVEIKDGRALVKGAKIIDGCLPWVRVTKDPERFSTCLEAAKKIGPIDDGAKVYELLAPYMLAQDQEVYICVLLDVQRRVRGVAEVARGQRSQVYVDPADILRPVIITGASSFWCCHQHPSGRSECSAADRRLTKAIEKATKAATPDVEFAGHIVVGQGEWCDAGSGKVHKVK